MLLFVHYFDPHHPYAPPPPWDTMYDSRGGRGLPDRDSMARSCAQNPGRKSPQAERMALQYAGEISYMDHHVGRLLDALDQRSLLEEAIVVVTSDHGENHWEHPFYFDHGASTYDTTIRALGLIRLPHGRHGGMRIEGVVAGIDILPTLLRFLELPSPPGIEGRGLDLDPPRELVDLGVRFAQATRPIKGIEADPTWQNMEKARCVRQGRYKLIQVPFQQREELYDLDADPLEQNNLLDAGDSALEEKAEQLRRQLADWAASARPLPSHFEATRTDETVERLRSLGYLATP